MLKGLEGFLNNKAGYVLKDISQFINSMTSPMETTRLYKAFFDAIRHELKDPQGRRDYEKLCNDVVYRNNQRIHEAQILGDEEEIDTHPNVLLMLVGHFETPSMYYRNTDFFRDNGIAHLYWMPLHHFQDIPTNAEYFIEMAEILLEKTGKEKIDVIAHSRGGLVASYAVTARPAECRKFNKIINIGTPFHGTLFADAAYIALRTAIGKRGMKLLRKRGYDMNPVKEMMYCSDFTERLSKYMNGIDCTEFYSIFSLGYDEAVVPGECAIIDKPGVINIDVDDYFDLRRVGHVGLAFHKKVLQLELDILKDRFDKEEFFKERPIVTFEEYRKEREKEYSSDVIGDFAADLNW